MDINELLNFATAIGTIGAAVFAGIAARVAAHSADASQQLVKLERQRDGAAHEATLWRQARRVTVETRGREVLDATGAFVGWDANVVVTNASEDPIFKTRIRIDAGADCWGPQLIGNLTSGHGIEVTARILTKSRDLNGRVRFVDVDGRGWVANSQTEVEPDNELTRWLDEGRDFAGRDLNPRQRGTVSRTDERDMPDFDAWSEQFDD